MIIPTYKLAQLLTTFEKYHRGALARAQHETNEANRRICHQQADCWETAVKELKKLMDASVIDATLESTHQDSRMNKAVAESSANLNICIAGLRSIASERDMIDGKRYSTLGAIRAADTLRKIGYEDFISWKKIEDRDK